MSNRYIYIYICMYHYVRDLKDSRYPNIKGLDIALFREQIDFFRENFNVVTMEQVLDALDGKCDLPEKALLLTFDDGYLDHYTYTFPILEEAGMQGSFFIPAKTFSTYSLLDVNKIHYVLACANARDLIGDVMERLDYYRHEGGNFPPNQELFEKYAVANRFDDKETVFVKRILQTAVPEVVRSRIASDLFRKYVDVSERQLAHELYMSEEQIRTMKRHGMFIGLHGYDHYWLGELSDAEMKADITRALDIMDQFIDRKRWVMNYPYGSHNDSVITFIRENGASAGLTTEVRVANLARDQRMLLPRLDCNDFPPKSCRYERAER